MWEWLGTWNSVGGFVVACAIVVGVGTRAAPVRAQAVAWSLLLLGALAVAWVLARPNVVTYEGGEITCGISTLDSVDREREVDDTGRTPLPGVHEQCERSARATLVVTFTALAGGALTIAWLSDRRGITRRRAETPMEQGIQ